jgi:hypothetical protein
MLCVTHEHSTLTSRCNEIKNHVELDAEASTSITRQETPYNVSRRLSVQLSLGEASDSRADDRNDAREYENAFTPRRSSELEINVC